MDEVLVGWTTLGVFAIAFFAGWHARREWDDDERRLGEESGTSPTKE
jgi:hypothetical protein